MAGVYRAAGAQNRTRGGPRRATRQDNPDKLGSIEPGKLADLTAYPVDPLAADPGRLADLTPVFTIVGGRPVHDPDKRLAR